MTGSTGTLVLARTREELMAAREGRTVALVPTMGALHAGHAALLRAARSRGDLVVMSLFVNPTQFAPGEDLDRYPRTFDADLALAAEHGADVVFAPSVEEVYPGGDPLVTVAPGPLGAELEGAARPTHFAGVLTVVAKLFGLARPQAAFFGEKDYQQLVLVRRMAADLCLGVDVVGVPIVREPDGLALSSRNRFLDPAARTAATSLSRALFAAQRETSADAALGAARAELTGIDVDYLALTAPDLGPVTTGEARLLVAARVGGVRLIDNVALDVGRAARHERVETTVA